MSTPSIFLVEGLDRLGKSTLIQGIIDRLGYHDVIHYSKPRVLGAYAHQASVDTQVSTPQALWLYQRASFENLFNLCDSKAKLIFDRAHLGEFVYSPLYRGYDGSYVFDLELQHNLHQRTDVRLLLLTENLERSTHFVDDGQSLGPVEKRLEEQVMFIKAFHRSHLVDKRVINVTAPSGTFRSKEDILEEALS